MRRIVVILLASVAAYCQNLPEGPDRVVNGLHANFKEALVGTYTLPDLGARDAKTWNAKRRAEIVKLFEDNQFGRSPDAPKIAYDVFEKAGTAFDGKAIRRQVTIYFNGDKSGPHADVLIYIPAETTKPVPLLLHLSFSANSTTIEDPGVKPGEFWNRDKQRVPAPAQGIGRLDPRPLLAHGFGVATIYYGDMDPDFAGGIAHGLRAPYLKPGQTEFAPGEWGTIGAWSWGASRVLDYLETDKSVDAKRVALMGVSRLGKTVLWTGARDTRFAAVIASCSGEGGAALSRRNYGETIALLTEPTRYPYQFCANYGKWGARVNEFPVDAHMLVALMAPRPLLLQTGTTDAWSDPKGEFLAAVAAGPVYRMLGKQDLGTDTWPPAGQAILHTLSYYMHEGGHGTIPSDWDIFLKFLDTHLR